MVTRKHRNRTPLASPDNEVKLVGSVDAEVLVVGSGPVGLTLACELMRRGTTVRIIERTTARERQSKGIAVTPRTLEIFDSLGVADRLLARGHRLAGNDIYARGRRIASIGYGRIGPTRYPFALAIPQWEVEDALSDALVRLGGTVETDTTLREINQEADGVTASLDSPEGQAQHSRFGWLVGCDGSLSTTRDLLGVSFEGEPYATTLLLADAVLEGDLSRDRSHAFQGPSGAFVAVPLPGGYTRAVVWGPPTEGHLQPTLEDIHALMDRHGPGGLTLKDPRWLSAFRVQRRIAARLRVGRCLLAGDAAHVHSPFGGQGMNTGIQDATNLGWKLAAATSGSTDAALLDSYEVERRQVAERVLHDTDRQTKAFLNVSGPREIIRDTTVRLLDATGVLDRRMAKSHAGYADRYQDSPLTHRRDRGPRPRPGDRLPDATVRTDSGEGQIDGEPAPSLHGALAVDSLTLVLIVGSARANDVAALDSLARGSRLWQVAVRVVATDRSNVASYPALSAVPAIEDPSGQVTAILGARRGAAMLVRPDGYVVCRSRPRGAEHLLDHVTGRGGSEANDGVDSSPEAARASRRRVRKPVRPFAEPSSREDVAS